MFGVRYAQKMLTLLVLDNNDSPEVRLPPLITAVFLHSRRSQSRPVPRSHGSVACVKFYDGSVFLGSDSTARTVINGLHECRTHSITAEAIDDKGRRVSDPVSIISRQFSLYKRTAHAIPAV